MYYDSCTFILSEHKYTFKSLGNDSYEIIPQSYSRTKLDAPAENEKILKPKSNGKAKVILESNGLYTIKLGSADKCIYPTKGRFRDRARLESADCKNEDWQYFYLEEAK